jgi:hypothetical protein
MMLICRSSPRVGRRADGHRQNDHECVPRPRSFSHWKSPLAVCSLLSGPLLTQRPTDRASRPQCSASPSRSHRSARTRAGACCRARCTRRSRTTPSRRLPASTLCCFFRQSSSPPGLTQSPDPDAAGAQCPLSAWHCVRCRFYAFMAFDLADIAGKQMCTMKGHTVIGNSYTLCDSPAILKAFIERVYGNRKVVATKMNEGSVRDAARRHVTCHMLTSCTSAIRHRRASHVAPRVTCRMLASCTSPIHRRASCVMRLACDGASRRVRSRCSWQSRSHCAIMLTLLTLEASSQRFRQTQFAIVDLAGAERPEKALGERISKEKAMQVPLAPTLPLTLSVTLTLTLTRGAHLLREAPHDVPRTHARFAGDDPLHEDAERRHVARPAGLPD